MVFRFRYEALLSYKRHLKEKAEIDLSRAQRQLGLSRDSLDNYRSKLQRANRHLGAGMKNRMLSRELKNHSDYVTGLNGKIAAQEVDITEQEKIVQVKTDILLDKRKQYKAVEKLKERDLKKWNYQQQLMERKMMNEVAVIRHGKEFL